MQTQFSLGVLFLFLTIVGRRPSENAVKIGGRGGSKGCSNE